MHDSKEGNKTMDDCRSNGQHSDYSQDYVL